MLLQKTTITTVSSIENNKHSVFKTSEDTSAENNPSQEWLDKNKKDSISENKSTILKKSLSNSKVDQRPLITPDTGDIISKTKAAFVMTEASQPLTTDRDNNKDMSLREWNLLSDDFNLGILT